MDFQTPKHSVDCCIRYFCCTCFFKQSFNQQRLQSNFTIGGNMFKRTIHPFFVYNHIRESSNEQRDDTQRSKRVEEYILYSLYNSKMTVTPAVPRNKIFAICESISYISFLFFIISLTAYAIYKIYTQL